MNARFSLILVNGVIIFINYYNGRRALESDFLLCVLNPRNHEYRRNRPAPIAVDKEVANLSNDSDINQLLKNIRFPGTNR